MLQKTGQKKQGDHETTYCNKEFCEQINKDPNNRVSACESNSSYDKDLQHSGCGKEHYLDN